jgi:hypothetical protein
VLAKPFEPQHVIGRVKELLARRRRGFEDVATVSDVAAVGDGEFPPPSLVPHQAPPTPAAGSIWRWPVSDDETAAPSVDPELAEEPTEAASRNGRDDYFDLDAAFSMLTSDPAVGAVPPAAPHPDPPPTADVDWFDSKVAEIVAAEPWDDIPVAPEVHPHADLPLTYEPAPSESSVGSEPEPSVSAPPPIEAVVETTPAVPPDASAPPDDRLAPIEESQPVEPEPLAVAAEAAPEAAQPPAPKPALPALADAFAALLAAEHGEPLPARSGLWPSTLAPSAEMREELVEQVVRRVLDRLSDTVVREAVADVVSTVAERLIREEIERIKASIK